ncbi:MAG: hypothetical protein KAT34_02760 [Candidatus Aminicenantes bacterium]|nr:hypothetical protein [Candidatus Aminicenantes bacterium]
MAIDRNKVIEDMSKVSVGANKDGIIPAFNVLVNQWPAAFWNEFSKRMIEPVDDDIKEDVEGLLINAAHECGYHTGYGIITSKEWDAAVKPMVENVEDVLHGAFAVFTAWGWADAEIMELVPGEKMVVRSYNYYEADIAEAYPGKKAPRLSAHMIRGVCGAFMDLAYGGDYDSTGNSGLYTFRCKQTKGIECGDEYGEFIAVKSEEYEKL